MFAIMRSITVTEGNSHQVVERFNQAGILEEQPGFVDLNIMVKQTRKGEEEVVLLFRWESEEAWKNWEKSDDHVQGHRQKAGQPKPEYVVDSTNAKYDIKAIKTGTSNITKS